MLRVEVGLSLDWRHRRYYTWVSATNTVLFVAVVTILLHTHATRTSAMESDIIIKRFQQCVLQHGVKYSKFIGDGDGSVRSSLVSNVPWGFAVEKVECANHSVKCFCSQLEGLVANNPNYKGRGKLIESMWKRLTRPARCAIVMRSKESDRNTVIIKLQQDLMNGPLHCFGIHTDCSTDFCKTAQRLKTNTNNSPLLQEFSAASISSHPTAVNESSYSNCHNC